MALTAPAAAYAQTVPTFRNGMAQDVFSADPDDWVAGEVWVETDRRQRQRWQGPTACTSTSRCRRETRTNGLKVPVVYHASPYFAGLGLRRSTGSSTTALGATSKRAPAAASSAASTRGRTSATSTRPPGFRAGSASCTRSRSAPAARTAARPPVRPERDARCDGGDRLAQRPSRGASRPGPATSRPRRSRGTTARPRWSATSYDGTIAIAAAATGVDGLAAIVPVSAISDWYDYYRANGLVRAPHSNPGGTGTNAFQGEDLDVLADAVYSRRDRKICRPALNALKASVARESGDRTRDLAPARLRPDQDQGGDA